MVFALVAIFGSFAPFAFAPLAPGEALGKFRAILQAPISAELRMDFAANVLLFVPLGFTLLGTVSCGRSMAKALPRALLVVAACAAFSVAIEFLQLWFPTRQSSLNDIVAEGLGALAGCVAWLAIGDATMAWLGAMRGRPNEHPNVRIALLAYCAAFAAFSALPGDANLSATEVYHKFKAGKIILVPLTCDYGSPLNMAYSLVRDVVCMIPVGACAAVCLLPHGRTVHALPRAIMQGMAYVAAIEIGQIFVISRYTDVTDLMTGFVGVAIGVVIMRRRLGARAGDAPAGRLPYAAIAWAAAGLLLAGIVFAGFWRPYNFAFDRAAKLRLDQFTAGLSSPDVWRSAVTSTSDVLVKTLPFAALGACFGMAICRSGASSHARQLLRAAAVILCGVLGLAIEVGQILLASHVAHVSEAALYGVGSLVGVCLPGMFPDRQHHPVHGKASRCQS
jgi:VanZ family protein